MCSLSTKVPSSWFESRSCAKLQKPAGDENGIRKLPPTNSIPEMPIAGDGCESGGALFPEWSGQAATAAGFGKLLLDSD